SLKRCGLLFFGFDPIGSFPLQSSFPLGVFFPPCLAVGNGQLVMARRVCRLEFHGSLQMQDRVRILFVENQRHTQPEKRIAETRLELSCEARRDRSEYMWTVK